MSLVNNSANNFKDFLDAIKPYLNYQFYDLSGQGVEANNFSTNEKVIGTWIDGKPLYQKTFEWTYANGSLIPDAGSLVIPSTADIKCICNGCLKYSDSSKNIGYAPIATTFPDSENTRNQWITSFSNISVANQSIGFRLGSGWKQSTYTNIRISVTMKYTKTTDTAVASGEKIVGQWIDGKPIYQKSFAFTNITTANVNVEVDLADLTSYGIDKFLYCEGSVTTTTSATWTGLLPGHFDNDHYYQVYYGTDKKLKLTGHIDWWVSGTGHADVYVTIRYTKTS